MNTLNEQIKSSSRVFQKPHPAGEFWVQSDRPTEIHDIIESQGFDEKRHGKWQVFNYSNINEIYQSLILRGNKKILLEGGPTLNGLFLKENLIDEIYFTIVPNVWSGQSTDRIITGITVPDLKFKLLNVERRKNEVFFRYRRSK
jgi:riboflavin biosynthesis pyrimidine reductase